MPSASDSISKPGEAFLSEAWQGVSHLKLLCRSSGFTIDDGLKIRHAPALDALCQRDRKRESASLYQFPEFGWGQAKSPLMAGIGLYEIIGQKRQRAEVYCIGEDRKTANVMFRDAVAMCRAPVPGWGEDTLESEGKVVIRGTGENAFRIEHPKSSSKFEPVANGDAISGPKPVAVMGDEIHEMKTNKAISVWRAAIAKRPGEPVQGRRGSIHVLKLHGSIMPRGGMMARMSGGASLEMFQKAFKDVRSGVIYLIKSAIPTEDRRWLDFTCQSERK